MPTDLVLKALSYGVIGLCAVILIATWRVLQTEQKREGSPRKGILQFATYFMAFCAFLAGLSAYVQISQANSGRAASSQLDAVVFKLEEVNNLLCDKVFTEVRRVRQDVPPYDAQQLEYLIGRLQRAVAEAWSYTDTERELRNCSSVPSAR